jgi:hypothetical protein
MVDNLPPSSADVTESGSLNLSEPPGPHRHVMGLLHFFTFLVPKLQNLCCALDIAVTEFLYSP